MTCGVWNLEREIGRGAYGIVYSAHGPNGAVAAVKVCRREGVPANRYECELRGARLYQKVAGGEGLSRLLEVGECDWGFYSVMELADDEFGAPPGESEEYRPKTLSRIIAGEKALSLDATLKLGLAITQGLVTLQRHHLLHRDIKPGNIIYVRGKPVLSDFGLLVEEVEAASLVGTPGYVPPENFTDAGGDVYSLGLTLKAASFGRSVDELELGPTLEADTAHPLFPAWWRILNKATHPAPARRYHSAKALLNDLRSLRRRKVLSRFAAIKTVVIAIITSVLTLSAVAAIFVFYNARSEVRQTGAQLEAIRERIRLDKERMAIDMLAKKQRLQAKELEKSKKTQ